MQASNPAELLESIKICSDFEGSGERTESRKMVKIDVSLEAGMNCAHFIETERRTNEG